MKDENESKLRKSDIKHEPAPSSAYTKEQKTTYDKGLKNKIFCH